MWLLLGGLGVAAGAAVWATIGAPLARMLAIHEDVSASGRRIPQSTEGVRTGDVEPLSATGDLRNLANSVGTRTIDTAAPNTAESTLEAQQKIAK